MIKAVLFDMDGILTDTEYLGVLAEDAVAKEMGLDWKREISYELLGLTKKRGYEILKEHFPELDPLVFFERFNVWMNDRMNANGVPIKYGAEELLRFLKENGIKTAVATSSPREALDFYMNKAGLAGYFDAFVSGENVKNSKPAPDSFLTAAQAVGVKPEECMVLEDSYNGIRSGRASGATVVMIPDLKPYTEECAPYVDHTAKDLTGVIDIIKKINGGNAMINVQAHRGASGYAPENTLASFKLAVAMKTDGIECDIHLTSDDVFVVCHDGRIDRTSDGSGEIRKMPFEELRRYDFGAKFHSRFAGEKIPTLEEMLDVVAKMKVVNIEIKKFGGDDDIALNRFYDILTKYDILGNTIVSSFDRDILKRLHELHGDVYTCLLYSEPDGDMPEIALSLGCRAIHPWIDALTKETVDEAHAKGLKVNCWTPNDTELLDKAVAIGCDGIISNYPDRAFAAIDRA